MVQVIKTTFQLRRGLLEAWERNNPVLAKGEPSFIIDKNAFKIGDGITPWKDLEYIGLNQEDLAKAIEDYLEKNPPSGGVQFKPDNTLILKDGVLSVNTTNDMEQDNTLPITSAGVFATVGNIEALLKTI